MLDEIVEAFMVYMTFSSQSKPTILIYLAKEAQIVLLITKEVKIPGKYLDFSNVFLE